MAEVSRDTALDVPLAPPRTAWCECEEEQKDLQKDVRIWFPLEADVGLTLQETERPRYPFVQKTTESQ